MKRMIELALVAMLLGGPVAAQTYTFPADKAGNELSITVKPAVVVPVPPKVPTVADLVDKLTDGQSLTLPAGVTASNGWIRVAGAQGVTIQGNAAGSTLDCQAALAAGRSCITNIVSTVPNIVNIHDLTILNGFGSAASKSDGTGCLRFYGSETVVNLTNVILAHCSDGVHGGAKVWNLKNVTVTDTGNRTDGLSHGIYINISGDDVCESLTIEDSWFETSKVSTAYPAPTAKAIGTSLGNGHQVKTGCKLTTIRNTTLVDGATLNSGEAINALNGGDVYLDHVTIIQRKTAGQKSILSNGAICTYGQGKWTFDTVTIVDEGGNGSVRWLCGKPDITLLGTNIIPAYMTVAGKPNMILAGPAGPK